MKNTLPFLLSLIVLLFHFAQSQSIQQIESKKIMLPNRWGITPIGKSFQLGDLPLNIAVSNSKNLMAVTNNGQSDQSIQLIDVEKQKVLDTILLGKSWRGLT